MLLLVRLLPLIITAQGLYIANAFVKPIVSYHSRIQRRIINDNDNYDGSGHVLLVPVFTTLNMLPDSYNNDFLSQLSSPSIVLTSSDMDAEAMASASLQGLRTFFGVSAALIVGAIGLYFVTGAIIVPKATQQLEKDTKRLRPGLWEEYINKANLKDGETMTDRPALLEELGNTMKPIIMVDFETEARSKK